MEVESGIMRESLKKKGGGNKVKQGLVTFTVVCRLSLADFHTYAQDEKKGENIL